MPNKEYVIKCLKYLHDRETWKEGLLVSDDHAADRRRITADALALLREQDTVEHALEVLRAHGWKDETEMTLDEIANKPPFQRHDCGALIVYRGRNVCPNCGKAVKWDA